MLSLNRITGFVLLLSAFLYTAAGWRLPARYKGFPGPGLVPQILAIALALLAVIILFQRAPLPQSGQGKKLWWRSVIVLASLFVYYLALPVLGYTLCNFGLVLGVRRTFDPRSWRWDVIGAVIIAVATHFIFVQVLDLSFTEFFIWE